MNDIVNRFVNEFESAQFSHALKLIHGLRSGTIQLHSSPSESLSSVSHYLDIYQFRLEGLNERPESSHTEHTKSLRLDCSALCDGFNEHLTDDCELWCFTELPYYTHGVFVGHESRIIMGCIRGVDDRLIQPELRRELWGDFGPNSGG